MADIQNDHLVLIGGESASGKSAALRNLKNPEGVMYLNCENNKKLPFRAKFKQFNVTDPLQIYEAFTKAETMDDVHTIVIDTLTYMMDMFETTYVVTAADGRKAWGEYAIFFRNLMQKYVAKSTKNVIFLGHTADVLDEKEQVNKTMVKVKGSLMNNGIESFFSNVVSCKKVPLGRLKNYQNGLLTVTPEEEAVGFKYVFQTKLTKETVNERIRSPMGLWDTPETYVDNDAQLLLDRLHEYYD